MGSKTSVLFLFLFLQTFLSTLTAHQHNSFKRIILKHENNENECICIEPSPHLLSVPKILDPDNEDIERLIVYIYRIKNGTITTYIPNAKKQALLPDLQYENGDSIKESSNPQLASLFSNTNDVEHPPLVDDSLIPELPHGGVVIGNHAEPVPIHIINSPDVPPEMTMEFGGPTVHQHHPQAHEDSGLHQEGEHPEIVLEYPEEPVIVPEDVIIANSNSDYRPSAILSVPAIPKGTLYKPTGLSGLDGNFNKWFVDQMNNIENQNSIKSKPINIATLAHAIQAALKDHGMFVSPSGVLTDSHGNILNITHLQLRPLLIGDTLEYKKVIENSNGTFSLPEHTTYLESLLIALVYPPKIIAIIPLGKVVLPNNIETVQITNEILMNARKSNKNEDQLLSTKKQTTFNDLTSGAEKDTQEFNSNIRKLFTNVNHDMFKGGGKVEKMLIKGRGAGEGINPDLSQRIKSIPNDFSIVTKRLEEMNPTEDVIENSEKNIAKEASALKGLDNYQLDLPIEKIVVLLQKIVDANEKKNGPNKVNMQDILKELALAREAILSQKGRSKNRRLQGRRRSQNTIFPTFPLLSPLVKRIESSVRPLIQRLPKLPGIPPLPGGQEAEEDYGEDQGEEMFRIIGGAAATGSGSPISNKGRSSNYRRLM